MISWEAVFLYSCGKLAAITVPYLDQKGGISTDDGAEKESGSYCEIALLKENDYQHCLIFSLSLNFEEV